MVTFLLFIIVNLVQLIVPLFCTSTTCTKLSLLLLPIANCNCVIISMTTVTKFKDLERFTVFNNMAYCRLSYCNSIALCNVQFNAMELISL